MSTDGFAEFCEESLDDVYRYALRLTGGDHDRTCDLVQETFVLLVRHHRERPDEDVGLAWLIRCCRHRFLDDVRRSASSERTRRRAWSPSPDADLPSVSNVVLALGELGELERVAIVLRHLDGLSVADVASELDRSVPATDSMLRRGRDRLRRAYLALEEREVST